MGDMATTATDSFQDSQITSALVLGAGHGIGLALTEKLLRRAPDATIYATYRREETASGLLTLGEAHPERLIVSACDPCEEDDIAGLFALIKERSPKLDLVLNSVGVLHDQGMKPEKSLRDIRGDHLLEYFRVNSIVTPLLAKHAFPFLKHKSPSCFATVSAKVGSISDNQLGGWYGYRASKAALNMFLKGISIEFRQRGCHTITLAIHPGTTRTPLAEPFIQRTKLQLHDPEETAENILNVINGKTLAETGSFYSWDGSPLPW